MFPGCGRKYDSHLWSKPMELIYGHQFKLEIWETFLASMKVGEVSEFTCPFHLVMSYPKVAAQLRKIMLENNANPEPESHCCGMSVQNISVGYHDLDHLISNPPKYLVFQFELLERFEPDSYEKETWTMSDQEKISRISNLREIGNEDFRNGDVDKASKQYYEAIALLDQLILKEKPGSSEHTKLNNTRCPLLLNFSQCCFEKEEFYKVICHTTEVLEHQPENVKAYFKRAKAHKAVHDYKQAIDDMTKAMELNPNLEQVAVSFINSIKEIQAENDKADEKLFKNMLKID
ncbi:AH receptor-interacting protein-like isoform X2 [Symsagittifera roscoffensis]|uniref:AH receptor-interacting protein-like isoform X2 n=1 Tax=Symsagittifera roscoffensis TaxID=84072 RepID=UPI00307C72D0